MSNTTLTIGTKVRRQTASTDNANGRIGEIVEVNNLLRRVRVLWTHEATGKPIYRLGKPGAVRTWVAFNGVATI